MLLVFTAPPRVGGATWFVLPQSPLQAFRHQDISVVDPAKCWIVSGRSGAVSRTTDGGMSWQQQAALPGFLRAVGFADSLHGWIGSLTADSLLYATTDGGETWTLVEDIPEPRPSGICGLWIASAQVIYGCGRYSGPPRVIKSTDGGASWTSMDLSAHASTLVDCYFVSPDTGFVVGGLGTFPDSTRGVVLATTDGGATWETRFTGSVLGEWGWKISFPTRAVGYVSLERTHAPVGFLKTTDGGASWARKTFLGGFYYSEQGIGFATETVGWIGGENFIYGTTDGGDTWQVETWGGNVNRFRFVNDSLGYAVGYRVYKYHANNPTFVTAGPGSLDSPIPRGAGSASANGALLFQNAPNPFTTDTAVDYFLEAPAFVSLAVYDAAGRRVASLVEARMTQGPHRAGWNGKDDAGRNVAAGTYVYRLQTEGHHAARRMVLLR